MSDNEISSRLELPIRTVRTLLYDLVRGQILTPAAPLNRKPDGHCYLIAMPPEKITAEFLIFTLDGLGGSKYMNEQALRCLETYKKIQALLDRMPGSLPIDELSRDFLKEEPMQS